ncbi:conjugal transfer protein TrbF [Erythrobacter rubeus]|uniref:Conjugal transfer protein TrbF n=1 Tax=Erythrobacter rubeus TaxID=2760803 RepID=A0ABR8KZD2_9SPHN|nr:conjugal transfer protein TrbF [Erythrobacter rubeus]MBD2843526.1 conjugal transfer protein TrbF [Erythrobacter rubeus]
MRFKRALQRYGQTPKPETPYQKAGQLWDERIGSARVQARNWRLMAFGGLFLTAGLASTLVWLSLQSRVTPYVVEVDRLGEARAVVSAETEYEPTDPQIAWHLANFIKNVRSVSLDPVLMRAAWLEAYDFATRRASTFLDEYARRADPFAEVGERTVAVQVTSVVRASDESFQVKWTEQVYERGSLADTSRWTAILTVRRQPPRDAEMLRKNPLGLYVEAIDWSRELETAATASQTPVSLPSASEAMPLANIPRGSPIDPNLATDNPPEEIQP